GGAGLPILLSWAIGGVFAAGVAWLIGKISLGLRSDYLAIATLGISEIVIALLKHEDWLSRGVKNVTGLPRPVPYEIELQQAGWFQELVGAWYGGELAGVPTELVEARMAEWLPTASSLFVKLCYTGLFTLVLVILLILASRALNSPWGRMMRAIRDNETAAEAMGKDVTRRHLQVFILGSAIMGLAGAMLTTYDGQFTPGTYHPLRFTFLIWVMVIVGGAGNNLGSVVGGFLIWFLWVQAEPGGAWLMEQVTAPMEEGSPLRAQLLESAQYMRHIVMGTVLLLVMRFSPGGILPERGRRSVAD
ncbi:MAG: branched-chain amino acid ABC transporter permease, partial [Gammaproteobacteria bacterium]